MQLDSRNLSVQCIVVGGALGVGNIVLLVNEGSLRAGKNLEGCRFVNAESWTDEPASLPVAFKIDLERWGKLDDVIMLGQRGGPTPRLSSKMDWCQSG